MKQNQNITDLDYKVAMGRLLVMYTQVDYLIMRAVAERIQMHLMMKAAYLWQNR